MSDIGTVTLSQAGARQLVDTAGVTELLQRARDRVEPALWNSVQSLEQPIRDICEYHFGWRDLDGTTRNKAVALGKTVRPALVFLAARAVDDGQDEAEQTAAAAARIELIHNFSLVHDDIMDEDKTRRHRETVWSAFGRPAGILAGDALLCLGLSGAATQRPGGKGELVSAVQELIHGQFLDLEFEVRRDVDLHTCMRMADLKTAALTAAACALGGHAGGGDAEDVDALRTYGRHFGMAFQLADDVLGIIGSSDSTGKAEKNDLCRRKRSLPIVFALTQEGTAAERLRSLYAQDHWNGENVTEALEIVTGLGAVDWARKEAESHVDTALDALKASSRIAASGVVPQFEALAVFASHRAT
jgi:geranylgeranyl diphosphate synthase type I